ncbi:hypothetical protein [Paenibacillus sp. UNC451MF]|uniref:hypothetical protein n=1 Tax=Paenibacillus sp. UNC451MF TaxID=1449063 RepID=UPI000B1853ED|nr:hypothetical protein [Paenibacillus sp. UNC451MF]
MESKAFLFSIERTNLYGLCSVCYLVAHRTYSSFTGNHKRQNHFRKGIPNNDYTPFDSITGQTPIEIHEEKQEKEERDDQGDDKDKHLIKKIKYTRGG